MLGSNRIGLARPILSSPLFAAGSVLEEIFHELAFCLSGCLERYCNSGSGLEELLVGHCALFLLLGQASMATARSFGCCRPLRMAPLRSLPAFVTFLMCVFEVAIPFCRCIQQDASFHLI